MASELEREFRKWMMAKLKEELIEEKANVLHKKIVDFDLECNGSQLYLVTEKDLLLLIEEARNDGFCLEENKEGLDAALNKCKSKPIANKIIKEL